MHILGSIFSPYVMRTMLAAWAKGHDMELAPAPNGLKSAEYRQINPLGKTPTLIDGALILPESGVIVEYLEEKLPGPSLLPGDAVARSRIRLVARFVDTLLSPGLTALFRGLNETMPPEAFALSAQGLDATEHFGLAGDTWSAADVFTLADAALMPMLFMYDYLDTRFQTGALIGERARLSVYWDFARQTPIGARMSAEMTVGYDRILPKHT